MRDLVLQPMGFGQILDGAFTLYRRHFAAMIGVVVVLYGPVVVAFVLFFGSLATYTPETFDPEQVLALSAGFGTLYLVALLAYTAVQGALTQAVSDAFLNRPVSMVGASVAALRRILPLVGGALLKALLIILVSMLGFVVIIPVAIAGAIGGFDDTVLGVVAGVVGVLAVLTLMSVAWAIFFAVTPVIMLERAGPAQAVVRSTRLARGRWIRIVTVLSVAFLIPSALWMGGFVVALLFVPNPVVAQVVGQVIAIALMPYYAICVVLLYYDARIRSEGLDLAILAEQLRPGSAAP